MNIQEIRNMMKENFIEISEQDWDELICRGKMICNLAHSTIYFKPIQKFPVVIEGQCGKRFEIDRDGNIEILIDGEVIINFTAGMSLLALEETVKKSQEVRR